MTMASVFTKIANGEIPSYKVAETSGYYAFLDINPLVEGHTLVIPKKETDYIFDINDEEYAGLWAFAKKVAKAVHTLAQPVAEKHIQWHSLPVSLLCVVPTFPKSVHLRL